ncbi:hypothetical protein H2248_005331 [Termitomyces sp. 'cryptogamus']|nr:hypothetical protein H2248_005331 [Termitomyces sp. 'cryptogamus']
MPFPISPWLLLVAIHGHSAIEDLDFVSSINPDLASKLWHWPIDPNIPLNASNIQSEISQMIVNHLTPSTPAELDGILGAEHKYYTRALYNNIFLLAHPDYNIDASKEIKAF